MYNSNMMMGMMGDWLKKRQATKKSLYANAQDNPNATAEIALPKQPGKITSSGSLDLGFGELTGPGVQQLMQSEDVQQMYNPNPRKGFSKGFGTKFFNTGEFGKRGLNQIARAGYSSPEAYLQANPWLTQARQQRQDMMNRVQSANPLNQQGTQAAGTMPYMNPRYV